MNFSDPAWVKPEKQFTNYICIYFFFAAIAVAIISIFIVTRNINFTPELNDQVRYWVKSANGGGGS